MKMLFKLKKRWGMLDKYTKWAFYIILLAFLIRFTITQFSYITGDACSYVSVIRYMAENYRIPLHESLGNPPFWQPPLVFVISSFFYKIFSLFSITFAEFQIKLLPNVASVLMLLYSFLVLKKLFDKKIAFYAIVFLAFIPDFIYYGTIPFVDIALGLFVVASIYYMLENKVGLSALSMGLALLTKYNALFAFPIPIFILYMNLSKTKKIFLKKSMKYVLIAGSLGSIWFIRNWVLLGSPIWPHFSDAFSSAGQITGLDFLNVFNPFVYLKLYLSFFGVPDGYYQNLFFLELPYLNYLIIFWLIGTVVFILPFFKGVLSIKVGQKKYKLLIVWFIPFVLLFLLTLTSGTLTAAGSLLSKDVPLTAISRYHTPIYPLIAVLWAIGFLALKKSNVRLRYLILFGLVVTGFVGGEFVKAAAVKNSWSFYADDYDFVKSNTPEDTKVLVPFGPCLGYNFHRYTEQYSPGLNDTNQILGRNISYVWVNQDDVVNSYGPGNPAVYSAEFLEIIERNKLIYNNSVTNTQIYEVR